MTGLLLSFMVALLPVTASAPVANFESGTDINEITVGASDPGTESNGMRPVIAGQGSESGQSHPVLSGPVDEAFNHANALYLDGKFEEAAEIYTGILSSGYHSAELYFNLGNAYYRSNKIPSAILNYERAALLSPSSEDIRVNLELARLHTRDRIEELPGFFLNNWWRSARNLTGVSQWSYMSIAAFVLFLVLVSGFLISRSVLVKKLAFWTGIALFVISVLSFALGLDRRNYIRNHSSAVVFTPFVSVKSSPDLNSADLFVIHEGTKVTVEDSLGVWRAIRLSDGNKGWLQKDAIEMIRTSITSQ